MVVRADGCATCARRRNEEEAGRVHELHDEERDDGDGNGDAGQRASSIHMKRVMRR